MNGRFNQVRFITVLLLFCYLISAFPVVKAEGIPESWVPGKDFVYVSDLECAYWEMYQSASDDPESPYHPCFDSNQNGGAISIAGVEYAKGIWTHPNQDTPAILVYEIGDLKYKYFSAVVGKDSMSGAGLVQFTVEVDGELVASSRELRFGQSETIQGEIAGGQQLVLYVYGVDGCLFDSSAWGNAILSMEPIEIDENSFRDEEYDPESDDYKGEYTEIYTGNEPEIYVSDLKWKNWRMIGANSKQENPLNTPSFNCNDSGNIIKINGKEYEKGIRTHPDPDTPADIVYDISKYSDKYEFFVATVGRESASNGDGYVLFQVLTDSELAAESPKLTLNEDYTMVVNIKGVKILTLRVDPTEDSFFFDSSAWGNARLCNLSAESVEWIEKPAKTKYIVGDTLNVTGGSIKVVFENGIESVVDLDSSMITGYDFSKEGKQTLTVTIYGKELTYEIDVEPAPTNTPEQSTPTPVKTAENEKKNDSDNTIVYVIAAITAVIAAVVIVVVAVKRKSKTKSILKVLMIFMITGVWFSESGGKGPSVLNAAEIDKSAIKEPENIFEQEGGTFRINQNFNGSALSIGAMQFNKGFILHANNDSSKMTTLEITLPDDEYKYFTAYVGIDEAMGVNGTVEFLMFADDELVKRTRILRGDEEAYFFSAEINGAKNIKLCVTDGGDGYSFDWGVWGDPVFYKHKADVPAEKAVNITSPLPSGLVSGKIRVTGTFSGGKGVAVKVNGTDCIVKLNNNGTWETNEFLPDADVINITATLLDDNGKELKQDSVDVYRSLEKTKEWSISSGDTTVRFALFGNTLAVTGIKNEKNGSEWISSPTVIPFIEKMYLGAIKRSVVWQFTGDNTVTENGETTVTLDFDAGDGVTMKSVWWAGKGGAVKHHIEIANNSKLKVTITYQPTFCGTFGAGGGNLSSFSIFKGGSTPGDMGVYSYNIEKGSRQVVSNVSIPIVFINRDNTEGVFVAHAYGTGEIRISGYSSEEMIANVRSGLNPDFKTDIPAGDVFYVPDSFIGTYAGDQDEGRNMIAKWLFEYNTPEIIRKEGWPDVIFASWNSIGGWVPSAENFKKAVDVAKELGMERIVLDYGWWKNVGEWYADPDRWPNGIGDVGKYIRDSGMDFVLYVLFHSSNSTQEDALTPVGPNAHPEWLVGGGTQPNDYADLGDEDCVAFIQRNLLALLNRSYANAYRSDFSPVQPSSIQKNRHRYGTDTEYWCYQGFYEILEYLYENIEDFTFENCCGGGYYKDFATMKYTANIQSTDTYKPLDARRSFYDASFVYPSLQISPQVMFSDHPSFSFTSHSMETRSKMSAGYRYRSVMMGVMYVNIDIPIWELDKEEHDFLKRQIEIYKEWIRPLVRNAKLYHITERPDDVNWDGMQYYDPETGKGIVYAFRPASDKKTETFILKGLEPDARYFIKSEDRGTVKEYTGKQLMEKGLPVTIDTQQYDADLLYIIRSDVPKDSKSTIWNFETSSGGSNITQIIAGIVSGAIVLLLAGTTFALVKKRAKKKS